MKDLGYIFVASLCFASSFTQDDMRKPPSITNDPTTGVIFRENDEVSLTCKAEGLPAVTYKWNRNGEEINLNNTNIRRGSDGDITIVEATRNDNGFYQCFATNQYGTALSTVAHIQMTFLDRTSSSIIVSMTAPEGYPFVIPAARRNSFPPPTYNWEITTGTVDTSPQTYPPSHRVHSASNGDLYFAYALKEDDLGGNIYKNTAFNPNIDVRSGGSYTRVMVTNGSGPPPDFLPNITYFSKSQEVALIGGSIELKCFFSGKPLPDITWSGPKNSLPSGRSSIPSEHHKMHLLISNIIKSDEGNYVCTATNTIGAIQYTHNIRVEAVPTFTQESDGPGNVNVTEGESVTFNCSAFANPEATVVWLRNGQPIDVTKAPRRFAFSNDRKSLTIRDVCRDCVDRENKTDLMVIQCNASNVHGYAFASGYLNVLLRTKVTLLPSSVFVTVDLTKENRIQFECSATSDPSTPPIIRWYKMDDKGQESVYNESSYVYVMEGNLTINIGPNCSTECDKYLGEYKCVGDNGITRDTKTVILNAKSDGPRNVNVTESDSVTFNCTAFAVLQATVGWLQNIQPKDVNNAPKRFLFSSDMKSLTIRDVCRDCVDQKRQTDLMVIQCNSSNVPEYASALKCLNGFTPPTCEVATYIPWWLIFILMLLGVLLFLVGICVGRCGKRSNENRVDFDTNQDPTVCNMNTSDKLNENARDDDINLKPVGSSASPLIVNTYM